jgi:cytochrome c553
MRFLTIAGLVIPLALFGATAAVAGAHAGAAMQGDAAAGQDKAGACTACHSPDDFAGLDEATILAAIKAVAAGEKSHPELGEVSAQDMADLAAFLAEASD